MWVEELDGKIKIIRKVNIANINFNYQKQQFLKKKSLIYLYQIQLKTENVKKSKTFDL